jgi:3-oxoacyl-[acyl-carrier protein] reductase
MALLSHGSVALVTGAGRGIGQAIAERLASEGAVVCVVDVDDESAKEVAAVLQQRGSRAIAVAGDVSKPGDCRRMAETAAGELGGLHILVNNAGLTRDTLIARMSDEDWRAVVETNLGGTFNTCRAAVRGMMRKRSGSIVNVSSIVGLRGNPGQTNYAASKAGIIGFTKALARELGSRTVRANVVAPGYVSTRLTEVLSDDLKGQMLGATPLGRFGDPEDVAAAVRFLSSDEASFITGEVLLVDGGLAM